MKFWQRIRWQQWLTSRYLARALMVTGGLLVVVSLAFGGYYYWDRFRPRGGASPVERAIQAAEQAVRENPSDPDLRLTLATLYYEHRLYDRAFEETTEILRAFPENEGALLLAGMAAVRLERPEEAISLLERFIALRKDRPEANADLQLELAYYQVGAGYVELGQSQEAVEPLKAALEISPTDADALYQLGLAYHHLGQDESAVEAFRKAVRLVPGFTEAYRGMAECYRNLDQPAWLLYADGMVAFGEQHYASAREQLEAAAQRLPDEAAVWLGLGLVEEQMGDLQASRQALERARTLSPHDLAVQQAYGRVQAALRALSSQETQP